MVGAVFLSSFKSPFYSYLLISSSLADIQSVKLGVDGRGTLFVLTGEEPRPEATAQNLQKWRNENSLVTPWLLNFMEDSIRKPFMFREACEIWGCVWETHSELGQFPNL